MTFIKVIQHHEAEGKLLEIYEDLISKRGKLAEVHKIQSLNPESIVNHMDLYLTIMFGRSPLKRYQREMIAVIVSGANQCEYCTIHHGDALNHFWKDKNKVDQLARDFYSIELNQEDQALCELAQDLTLKPFAITEDRHIKLLKALNFEDRAILDATLVISYFNFVNRMVMGLGVDVEEEGGKGYEYD